MSQPELAAKAGIAPSVIYLAEKGRSRPRSTTLRKIANALGVSVDTLLGATIHERLRYEPAVANTNNGFVERLTDTLSRLGIAQAELARRVGMSPVTLYRIFRRNSQPKQSTLTKIAQALGVSPAWLAHGSDAMPQPGFENNAPWIVFQLPIQRPHLRVTEDEARALVMFYAQGAQTLDQLEYQLHGLRLQNHPGNPEVVSAAQTFVARYGRRTP